MENGRDGYTHSLKDFASNTEAFCTNGELVGSGGPEKLDSLRENSQRYLRVRLATKILRNEVEKYRKKSQGPVLKRAGALFPPLTQRFFIGLEPDYYYGD